ncbi:unnamed protein product [Rotaria magnacalcarata]|uniref:Uncharacterized protein n=1 Tax=Rotaria magnacalcarata TaxID=392030 RepID=A0A816VPM2_9BILA|nr:unnamed protein product [Rotaria magnacalcarata]
MANNNNNMPVCEHRSTQNKLSARYVLTPARPPKKTYLTKALIHIQKYYFHFNYSYIILDNKSKSSPCIACSSSMATNRMIAEERESRCLVQSLNIHRCDTTILLFERRKHLNNDHDHVNEDKEDEENAQHLLVQQKEIHGEADGIDIDDGYYNNKKRVGQHFDR